MILRKAVLVIHGFAGGTYDIEFLANELEYDKNFDVFTFTLPGHNKLTLANATKEEWTTCVENQIEKLIAHNYSTIYVIGHSMGCVLAGHLAVKYKQVKKIVMLSPAYNYFTFKGNSFSVMKSLSKTKEISLALKDYGKDEVVGRIIKSPYSSIKNFTELVREHYDDPKKINIPILIIHGSKDKIAPINSAEYVHNNVKSKVNILVKVRGATHDIAKSDKIDQIIKLIYNFLKYNKKYYNKEEIEI